jgi:hypothetical protein
MSLGRQVLSNQGSSGPYSRKIANQPFFGTVAIQLASLPAGAFGPKWPTVLLAQLSQLVAKTNDFLARMARGGA